MEQAGAMRQSLSTVLAAHWAGVFGVFAYLCASEPEAGAGSVLGAFGWTGAVQAACGGGDKSAALLAMSFAVAASLFLWMLVGSLFGHAAARPENCRKAFAAGALSLVLLAAAALLEPSAGRAFLAVECLLAAVLVSFLAAKSEQFLDSVAEEAGDVLRPARRMALEAAHQTLLSHVAGRADDVPAGRN